MKLLRYGPQGAEKPGPARRRRHDPRPLRPRRRHRRRDALATRASTGCAGSTPRSCPRSTRRVRLGPCVGGTGKFICIGLNYSDHAAETGATVPPEPIIFMKATSAICGPNDPVIIPRGSQKTDWEVELGVVIGKRAKYVTEADALDHVAGYCVVNDVSERAFQTERQGQWTKGKSGRHTSARPAPGSSPATRSPTRRSCRMWLKVNGETPPGRLDRHHGLRRRATSSATSASS